MKFINKISVLLLSGSLAFTGCESLDQDPYDSLSTNVAFESIDDAQYWRNGFYRSLRRVSYGESMTGIDAQSDLLNAANDYGNRGGLLHSWTINSDDSTVKDLWSNYYDALASLNKCIEAFPKIPISTAKEQESLDQYLGEAHALRAYYFFQLVKYFSPNYEETNKSQPDLGVPLVIKYDVTLFPKRSTLEEVYTQILSDVAKAEQLLKEDGEEGANVFTKDAVIALKAQVLLAKKDYAEAFNVAKNLITSNRYPLVNTKKDLQEVWYNDNVKETIVQLSVSSPDELPNTNSIYLGYSASTKKYTPDFVPSKWVVDLYENNDIRKDIYFQELPIEITGATKDAKAFLVNKYPGNPKLYSGVTNYAHAPKIFRIAEFYLIAAEAAYKESDETNAKVYLNALRKARGLSDVTSSGVSLFEDIKNERLRELAFEGTRLNDLKRWGDSLKRHTPQSTDYILTNPAEQFHMLEKAASSPKFTWPIPSYDMGINPNLKQNPGYN